MQPPLFPPRQWYTVGDRPETLVVLEKWVTGATFHRYAPNGWELFDVFAREEIPALLEFHANLIFPGRLTWSYRYQRAGDPEGTGHGSGHSHPADAAYCALSMIEEHERELFESTLLVGVA